MNTPNPAVETIFNAARALPPESRAEYLTLACRKDAALHRQVEELLAAADEAERFFEANPVGLTQLGNTVMDTTVREGPGTRIGRYKLLQQIGEGGMGVVYMAEQEEPVRRRVALKIIKLGMDSKQVVARFEAERQALAMMDHPNIARVLDGGTTDSGRPYFVMELVQGVSIIEFCDKARLPAKERLDLFLQVCAAVQSAHQKGIIHRDLKPSNILVTQHHGKPMPKVIDFGIAKATNQKLTERTLFTQHATMIGTPAYMSPEQAEMSSMDVDTRSDIYSLGVLLYELLTGSTPFPEKRLRSLGYGEMQRVIAEEEPERPSARLSTLDHEQKTVVAKNRGEDLAALNTRLQGDLDWIVMKCLEKDRTHRYETANGLAADLQRHLNHEAVIARPPSWGYRVQKTVRRHRSAFATAGVVLVALLLGLGISAWQAVQKTRALARMTEAEQAQSRSREVAEKALTQEAEARRRVDELLEREKAERRAGEARLYATDIHLAQQAMDKDNFDRVRELLARHYPRPGQTNRPGWEWRYLWQQLQDDASFEVCRLTNIIAPVIGAGTPGDNRWLLQGNRNADRAWIEVLDITDLHAPRHAGEIPMPSSNAISAIALGNRNGRVAYAQTAGIQAWGTRLVMDPGATTTISIYDTATRRTLETITNLTGFCPTLAWSGDNQFVLSYSTVSGPTPGWRSRIDVWRASDLTHVTTLTNFPKRTDGGEAFIRFAATADASVIAVASKVHPLSVIDVATGAMNWSLASERSGFADLVLAPDGHTLFVLEVAVPGRIRVFDLRTGKELCSPIESPDGGALGGLVVASDGRTLASRSSKGSLYLWEVGDLSRGPKALPPLRSVSWDLPLAFLPDARTLLTRSGNGTVLGWDLTRDRQPRQPLRVEFNELMAKYQLHADTHTLLIASWEGAVTQRHGNAFRSETPLFNLGRRIGPPIFSEDGRWFAAGSTNGFVEVWNVLERRRIAQVGNYPGPAGAVQFSQDGTRLIVQDLENSRYAEWDWAAAREIRTFPSFVAKGSPVDMGTLSHDGQYVLAANLEGELTWMDTRSGEKRDGNLSIPFLTKLAFVPGGERFAAGSREGYARLYDSRTFNPIATVGDGSGPVYSFGFLDGGSRLILGGGGNESRIALWDLASQLELVRLESEGLFRNVSSDGSVLIADSILTSKNILHLWRAPSWEEIERAEAARPNITAAPTW